ncbi:MAG: hypothetical protein ACJ76H_09930 [Bacteriovoracaceae bacterium]
MKPHYYLMKCKKILRLEGDFAFESLSAEIRDRVFDQTEIISLDQEQANWRVAIFRDEILDLEEYTEWFNSAGFMEDEEELELVV